MLASRTKRLYVGVTSSLERRVWEHKTNAVPSFSGRYKIYKLVYYEEYRSIQGAIDREKQVKAWRREKKVHLVESINPEWDAMAEHWYTELGDSSLRSE